MNKKGCHLDFTKEYFLLNSAYVIHINLFYQTVFLHDAIILVMMLIQIGVAFGMSVTVVFLTTPKMMTSLFVVSIDLGMRRMAHSLHVGLESVVLVRAVLHNPLGSVGLVKAVLSLDHVSIAMLPLVLVVSRFVVLNSVLEPVLGVGVVLFVVLRGCDGY